MNFYFIHLGSSITPIHRTATKQSLLFQKIGILRELFFLLTSLTIDMQVELGIFHLWRKFQIYSCSPWVFEYNGFEISACSFEKNWLFCYIIDFFFEFAFPKYSSGMIANGNQLEKAPERTHYAKCKFFGKIDCTAAVLNFIEPHSSPILST